MTDLFHFELVTPEKLYFSGEASMVIAPGAQGDFGVLTGHSPLVSTLRFGVVEIHTSDAAGAAPRRVFVAGGLAEVNGKSCTILAEDVEELTGISRETVKAQLDQARQTLERAHNEQEKHSAEKALARAEALLHALGNVH